ncbi:hypothetical protein DPMN_023097 [Dreissena polymorpha]|uniref:Uncharacterized protein n=1 Tax=Dreissena polymorpha TaxID=45954 RepID=A0A9D4RBF9_DREPO|nr:hypothetical protein DPMN_023097 [Dreissena polymorpha]
MREDQSAAVASSLDAASTSLSLNTAKNDAEQDFTHPQTSLIDNDHRYIMREDQRSAAGASTLEAASTPPSLNSAINDAVQDFTLLPNNHEQFDLLTFFANSDKQIQHNFKTKTPKRTNQVVFIYSSGTNKRWTKWRNYSFSIFC